MAFGLPYITIRLLVTLPNPSNSRMREPTQPITTEARTTINNPYDPQPQPGAPQPLQLNVPNSVPSQPQLLRRPRVCVWYNVYCSAMLLLYVVVACVGVFLALNADSISTYGEQTPAVDAKSIWLQGMMMTGISIPVMFIFVLGLLTPRRPWGWGYGFVPIAIGLTSPCCLPASIPLLLFWLKPGVKQWFNMS